MSLHIVYRDDNNIIKIIYTREDDAVIFAKWDSKKPIIVSSTIFEPFDYVIGEALYQAFKLVREHGSISGKMMDDITSHIIKEQAGLLTNDRVIDWTHGIPTELGDVS